MIEEIRNEIEKSDEAVNADESIKVPKSSNEMNNCVFPCYPTAFVAAKDVTVQFVSKQAILSSFAKNVENQSGGFFIFGGSSLSGSSFSTATSSANNMTVRFNAPQILGYYLEAVVPDKSASISNSYNENSNYISIFEFITVFKNMLDDHNSKYNRNLLSN